MRRIARGVRRIIPARAGFTYRLLPAPPVEQDHPRSRGVYHSWPCACTGTRGSSPLARGLLFLSRVLSRARGIIPARAGFTLVAVVRPAAPRDHPRSRGVYRSRSRPVTPVAGSSPLARGLLVGSRRGARASGIIPARAGFTPIRALADHTRGDHPRSRGVYRGGYGREARGDGSSPLARGLPDQAHTGGHHRRIIPARAGFTGGAHGLGVAQGDHPRSRGVYSCRASTTPCGCGSSPLARGLHGDVVLPVVDRGIIPARAGFTRCRGGRRACTWDHPRSRGVYPSATCSASRGWDHPRSRGVYEALTRLFRGVFGSSPLARGLRRWKSRSSGGVGIIPARAGFTTTSTPRCGRSGDHPRSRGVYVSPRG